MYLKSQDRLCARTLEFSALFYSKYRFEEVLIVKLSLVRSCI